MSAYMSSGLCKVFLFYIGETPFERDPYSKQEVEMKKKKNNTSKMQQAKLSNSNGIFSSKETFTQVLQR